MSRIWPRVCGKSGPMWPSSSKLARTDGCAKKQRQQIDSRIAKLARDPRPVGCQKLSGDNSSRVRQGDHRLIYVIEEDLLVVTVENVRHRGVVYRRGRSAAQQSE